MGFFTKKPDGELQAEFVKQATGALTWFGHALQFKKTNPRKGLEDESIDLLQRENRDAIRSGLIRLIAENNLGSRDSKHSKHTTDVLVSLVTKQNRPAMEDAVLVTMFAIHSMNMITRFYYEEFPEFKPLYEMVNNLAKIGCSGAAQTIGADLPDEIATRWPYFARIFQDAKAANSLWPDV